MYKLIFESKEIELPDYTLDMMDKIEELDNFKGSNRALIEKIYDFIKTTIGEEKTVELIGELNSVDVNDINILFSSIIRCYKKPYEDYQLKETGTIINSPQIKQSLDAIGKVIEANKKND